MYLRKKEGRENFAALFLFLALGLLHCCHLHHYLFQL